jgi:hypothetical protein
MKITVKIFVIDVTPGGKALKCSMKEGGDQSFYLPKSQLYPDKSQGTVRKNHFATFNIPEWLYLEHRQMCGDEKFEQNKRDKASKR